MPRKRLGKGVVVHTEDRLWSQFVLDKANSKILIETTIPHQNANGWSQEGTGGRVHTDDRSGSQLHLGAVVHTQRVVVAFFCFDRAEQKLMIEIAVLPAQGRSFISAVRWQS